ncbi:GAF and ANTAR domain-containing protein [Microlunatus parietis]|uniref:GAF domain-containing protein n=1 Tax=Microlunatus parietis TaxID=682979 RepID=A0A7Y9I4C9_9ACTN|nr:GAF and ANTAR domain-containing protein [Microlunatus parietis]NYE70042.1 GAF domain-containing protein [Microlunatus parietis]
MTGGELHQSLDHEALGLLTGMHEAGSVEETVEAVADFAKYAFGASSAAILLGQNPKRLEVAASTEGGDALVRLAVTDSGPISDAFESPAAVVVGDITAQHRWPGWPPDIEHDLRSLLLVRLRIGQRPAGLLLAGHPEPGAFDTDDAAVAHIVARHASVAVAGSRQQATLAEAVDARKLVGQAMGILMERYEIDSDRAFAVLRRYSQDTNTKLRQIAIQLIETRALPGLEPPRRTGDD